LEDATAIQMLSEAKAVSNDISEKEVIAEGTQRQIAEARVGYKPCGAYNAVLFFCIRDMVSWVAAGCSHAFMVRCLLFPV
jgi:dynein heavy chain